MQRLLPRIVKYTVTSDERLNARTRTHTHTHTTSEEQHISQEMQSHRGKYSPPLLFSQTATVTQITFCG